jgi:hypothetical protein
LLSYSKAGCVSKVEATAEHFMMLCCYSYKAAIFNSLTTANLAMIVAVAVKTISAFAMFFTAQTPFTTMG